MCADGLLKLDREEPKGSVMVIMNTIDGVIDDGFTVLPVPLEGIDEFIGDYANLVRLTVRERAEEKARSVESLARLIKSTPCPPDRIPVLVMVPPEFGFHFASRDALRDHTVSRARHPVMLEFFDRQGA